MKHLLSAALFAVLIPTAPAALASTSLAAPTAEAAVPQADQAAATLEKLLPGFAGLYRDAQGRPQIALVPKLTDAAEWSVAQSLIGKDVQRIDAKFSLSTLKSVQQQLAKLAARVDLTLSAQIDLPSNRIIVTVATNEDVDVLTETFSSVGIDVAAIEFVVRTGVSAKASTYGICPNPQGSGPQRSWRDQVTAAYLRDDLNQVWWLMKGAATAGGILGRPVGSVMLSNFLSSSGNVTLDYVGPLSNLPTVFGPQSGWISNASAVTAKIAPLDTSAIAEARRRVRAGTLSGVISYSTSVETVSSVDSDLYFAMGKFALKASYKFTRVNQVMGTPFIRVERVYEATDLYDWNPPRNCGIIDHIIPFTLARAGKAANFNILVRWGQPEYRVSP